MSPYLNSLKTTAIGVLVFACSGTAYLNLLPDKYTKLLMLACGVATAAGFIAAKDATVTGTGTPPA